ncbi:MAG: hypothetical protein O3B13_26185, partial [Planctomycetota bacterium]|nr:hypothetical protein [Planctomycetota bacterium]
RDDSEGMRLDSLVTSLAEYADVSPPSVYMQALSVRCRLRLSSTLNAESAWEVELADASDEIDRGCCAELI